ncbi:Prostaglandin E2 receptor EP3 subtype [Holothuria leucospilota]|uniref:Prostaglandin E2 receptor EP3 subtype n=1 Tax=Holothuria leucospilota TaxID=206669 RepID=A0A9Q1BVE2_HOLLE|nr:Prostaglandin E2 receptor EP3 subtype [Holothuria leucospilota]
MAHTNQTTPSDNTIPPNEGESNIFVYISYLTLTILLTVGLISHILAILATWRANKVKAEDNRHSLPSFLLTCLLRIDMVAVIFFLARGFLPFIPSVRQQPLWCEFSISTSIFFTWSSGLANCLMCAERSTSLIAPFFHRTYATLRKAKVSLTILQLSALLICCLPFFGFGTYKIMEETTSTYDCVSPGEPQAIRENKYHFYFSILFFVVGFSIITCILICNVIIVYFIFHLRNKVAHLNVSAIPAGSHDATQNSSMSTVRKSSNETRFAMIMILVSIAYMISWLPLYVSISFDVFILYCPVLLQVG